MPIPQTFAVTASGQLDLTNGLRLTTTLEQFVAARVAQRLRWVKGEWFLDTRQGTPGFEYILVSRPDLALITTIIRRVILGTPYVASVEGLVATFARAARTLNVKVGKIVTTDGTEVVDFANTPLILDLGDLSNG